MTALIFLESLFDPSEVVKVQRADVARASTTYLRTGYLRSRSTNCCICCSSVRQRRGPRAGRVSPYGTEGFIARMNEKAASSGCNRRTTRTRQPAVRQRLDRLRDGAAVVLRSGRRAHRRRDAQAEFDFVPVKLQRARQQHQPFRSFRRGRRRGKTGFISGTRGHTA
ncbi:MAG: hypothetical protein R2708_28500 [Vicinamibacterales bacterium]